MATEKQANKARQVHADKLEALGVHAIGVDVVKKGSKDFGVIAFLEKDNLSLPKELAVNTGTKKITVPLLKLISRKFQPE